MSSSNMTSRPTAAKVSLGETEAALGVVPRGLFVDTRLARRIPLMSTSSRAAGCRDALPASCHAAFCLQRRPAAMNCSLAGGSMWKSRLL
jgi:hypothetical protein